MSKEKTGKSGFSVLIIASLFYFVIGGVMLFVEGGLGYIIYILATAMIVLGILWVIRYLKNDGHIQQNNYDFSFGMLIILGGIWLLVQHYSMSVTWVPRILAVAAALTSVMKMQDALTLWHLKDEHWPVFFGMAVVTLVMSAVILFADVETFVKADGSVSPYVPVVLFLDGIFNLVITFRMSGKIKEFKNKAEKPAGQEGQPEKETAPRDSAKANQDKG